MSKISRRQFLLFSGGIAGAAALAGLNLDIYYDDPQNYLRGWDQIQFVREGLPAQGARLKLTNGRPVDVATGRYFDPPVSLVLQDGVILAMPGLPGEPQDIPCELQIDLKGRSVIPGLFNTHCHVQLINPGITAGELLSFSNLAVDNLHREWQLARSLGECLARGITTLRDAWAEDLRQVDNLRLRIEVGQILAPRLLQSVLVSPLGGAFAPLERDVAERATWKALTLPTIDYASPYSGVITFPANKGLETVRLAVDRAVDERGAQMIKIYDQRCKRFTTDPNAVFMTLKQLETLVDRAAARGLKTLMHHNSLESFRRGVQVGVTSLDHFPYDQPLEDADIAALLDSQLVLTPTLWTSYASSWQVPGPPVHPDLQRLSEYRQRTYEQMVEDYWIPQLQNQVRSTIEVLSHPERDAMLALALLPAQDMIGAGLANLRRLASAGVQFACGNDAGAVMGTPAMLREELRLLDFMLNQDGVSEQPFQPKDALRAATLNSARALGLGDRLGSLKSGKTADLVILDGDPLSDISLIGSRAAAVFMDGKLVTNNCGLELKPASA